MGRVVYVRHGQASLFSDNYDQLSELGHIQSRVIGKYFLSKNIIFNKIYLGPLERHKQTLSGIKAQFSALNSVPIIIIDGLKEHQGYISLKMILPELIKNDEPIRNLINSPFTTRKEQINHHIRVYDHFAQRWALGEFDEKLSGHFQTWKEFYDVTENSYREICQSTLEEENVLVITSGGPTSVAYGLETNLDDSEILKFSSKLFNGSTTTFVHNKSGHKKIEANIITHFQNSDLHTLV